MLKIWKMVNKTTDTYWFQLWSTENYLVDSRWLDGELTIGKGIEWIVNMHKREDWMRIHKRFESFQNNDKVVFFLASRTRCFVLMFIADSWSWVYIHEHNRNKANINFAIQHIT